MCVLCIRNDRVEMGQLYTDLSPMERLRLSSRKMSSKDWESEQSSASNQNNACQARCNSSGPKTSSGIRLPARIILKLSGCICCGSQETSSSSAGSFRCSFSQYSNPSGYPNCRTDASIAWWRPRAGTTGGRPSLWACWVRRERCASRVYRGLKYFEGQR